MSTCAELSQSKEAVTALSKLFKDLEHSATPLSLLLPNWFPKFASAKRMQEKATKHLCDTLSGYVDLRRLADVPRSTDAMDYLIAQGSSNQEIVDVGCINFLLLSPSTLTHTPFTVRFEFPLCRRHQHRHDGCVFFYLRVYLIAANTSNI